MSEACLRLAKRFWADDISGAIVPHSRLFKILDDFSQGKKVTVNGLSFLEKNGLKNLSEFIAGDISESEFLRLAPLEQKQRIAAPEEQLKAKKAAEAHYAALRAELEAKAEQERRQAYERRQTHERRLAAMLAEIHAEQAAVYEKERIRRESDPKFIAQQKNRALRKNMVFLILSSKIVFSS